MNAAVEAGHARVRFPPFPDMTAPAPLWFSLN
jgi:hypothetical protein